MSDCTSEEEDSTITFLPMENIHFLIKKTNKEYPLERKIKSYRYLIRENLLQIFNGERKIFQKDFFEKILKLDVENRKIFLLTENHIIFFNGKEFIKKENRFKYVQYCKIINNDILAIQTANAIILLKNDLTEEKRIENIDSSIFLKTEFLFFCVRNKRIFFMQLNGEFHNEILSLDEVERNCLTEYVDYDIQSIEGDKLIHTILNVGGIYVMLYSSHMIFLKYENGLFYMKSQLKIPSTEQSIKYCTDEYFIVDNLKIRLIKTIDCKNTLFIKNRDEYYLTDFTKSCLPLPLYHSKQRSIKKTNHNFKLTKNYYLKYGNKKIRVEKYKFIRKFSNKKCSAVQINNTVYVMWNDNYAKKFKNISSFFLHKNYLILMQKNKCLEFYRLKKTGVEKIYEQEIFENATILTCFDTKLIFFIERGNFEIQYPKFLVENKLQRKIRNEESRNFNEIFYEMKKHIIPFTFISKKYRDDILTCKIDYLIEYFKVHMFPTDKRAVENYLLRNISSEEYLIAIFKREDIQHRHILLLLIYQKYYDLLVQYVYLKGRVEEDINLLKKYISEDELVKNILRTYEENIIKEYYTILGKEYNFTSGNLKIEVNEYLNDPVEKLRYLENIEEEIQFIKKHNLYEEALIVCTEKNREKNFYYKLYSENTVGEKSARILFSVGEYEMAINRAVKFSEYAILHEIYKKINKEYVLEDENILTIYKNLERGKFYEDLGNINFLLGNVNYALIFKTRAHNYEAVYDYARKLDSFTEDFIKIYAENSKNYCIINFDKLNLLEQSYEKYFKKFNSLQEYMDCEEMTASTVSSMSLLKGLKGLKKKFYSQKIKYEIIQKELSFIAKIDLVLEIEREDLTRQISSYEKLFKVLLSRADRIISTEENF